MILMIGKCNNGTCEYCGEEGTAKYQIISVILKKNPQVTSWKLLLEYLGSTRPMNLSSISIIYCLFTVFIWFILFI